MRGTDKVMNCVVNDHLIVDCGQIMEPLCIKLVRLVWAGHVYRMENYRIPMRMLEGRLYGTSPKGCECERFAMNFCMEGTQVHIPFLTIFLFQHPR